MKPFERTLTTSRQIILALILMCTIQSCAIKVSEKNIILVDEQLLLLGEEDLLKIGNIRPNLTIQSLTLPRTDGNKAKGLWIKQPDSNAVIIYFSGNSMRIKEQYAEFLPHLLALNTDVVWLDHRGIGSSEGEPTMENLLSDGIATYNYVLQNTNKKVILHGLSLGSFIAGKIAQHENVKGLILEASATNANDWINGMIPWYAEPIYSINIEEQLKTAGNESVVQVYANPLFVLVGEEDEVTPAELSKKLYELSISKNKNIYIAKGLKHGNALKSEETKTLLRQFIQTI